MERLISGWFSFDPKDREADEKAAKEALRREEEKRVIDANTDVKFYMSPNMPGFITWAGRGSYFAINRITKIQLYEFKHLRDGESCAMIYFDRDTHAPVVTKILPYAQTNELLFRLLSGKYAGLLMDGLAEAAGAAGTMVTKGGPGGDIEQGGVAPSITTTN